MLKWVVILMAVAVVAAQLGFGNLAGFALCLSLLILAVLVAAYFLGIIPGHPPK